MTRKTQPKPNTVETLPVDDAEQIRTWQRATRRKPGDETNAPHPYRAKLQHGIFANRIFGAEEMALFSAMVEIFREETAFNGSGDMVQLELFCIHVEMPAHLLPVSADYTRLERILVNLLSNALKFSDPGTPVRVQAQPQDDEVVIMVTDQGKGIPPEAIPHLFERFYRVPGEQKAEGIGLGLYITKVLVEAHGGRIWVEVKSARGVSSRLGDQTFIKQLVSLGDITIADTDDIAVFTRLMLTVKTNLTKWQLGGELTGDEIDQFNTEATARWRNEFRSAYRKPLLAACGELAI